MNDCKVFFTKVPLGSSVDDLRSHFGCVGTVTDIFCGKDNKYGFVTFSDAKEAQQAIKHINNKAPYYLMVDYPKKTEKSYSNSNSGNNYNRDDRSDDSNKNSRNQPTFGGSMNAHLTTTSNSADDSTNDFKITEVINYLVKVKEPNFLQHLNMAAREYVQKNLSSISPVIDSYNTIESNAAKLFKPEVTTNGDPNNFDFKFAEPKYNEPKSINNNTRSVRKPYTGGTRSDFSENSSFSNGDTDREDKNRWSQPSTVTRPAGSANGGQQRSNYNSNDDYISQFVKQKPKPKSNGEFKPVDEPKPFRDEAMDNDNWDDEPEIRNEPPKFKKEQQSFESEVKPKPVTPLKKVVSVVTLMENRQLPSNEFSKVIVTVVESENTGCVVLADKMPEIMKMQAEFQKLAVKSNFVPELNKICVGFINGERVRVQITELNQDIVAKCIDSGATISANSDNFIDIEDEKIINRPAEAIKIEVDNSFTLQEDLCFEVKPLFIKKSKTVLVLARNENDTYNFDEVISNVKIPEFNLPKLPVTCEPTKTVPTVPVIEKKRVAFDAPLPEIPKPPVYVPESKIKSFVNKNTLAAKGFIELYYAFSANQVVGSCVVDEYAECLDEIEIAAAKNVDPNYSPNVGDYCVGLRSAGDEWARGMVIEKHANNDYVMALVDYGLKETVSSVRPMAESLLKIPNFAALLETNDPTKFVNTTFCFDIIKKDDDQLHATFGDQSGKKLDEVMILKPFYADLYF